MSTTRIEDIHDQYVVVPEFADGGYGMTRVARGDMSDAEWNTWNRVRNILDIKRIIKGGNCRECQAKIIAYLTEKGFAVCKTNQERPIF